MRIELSNGVWQDFRAISCSAMGAGFSAELGAVSWLLYDAKDLEKEGLLENPGEVHCVVPLSFLEAVKKVLEDSDSFREHFVNQFYKEQKRANELEKKLNETNSN
jgi:hypothetical protein